MGQIELPAFRNSTTDDNASIYTQPEDGISLYTEQSEDEMNDTPPAYSDASGSVNEPLLRAATPRATIRKDHDVRIFKKYDGLEMVMDSTFDTDPVYAEELVREWCTYPAQQMIKIQGTHTDDSRGAMKNERTVVDFEIDIPLVDYLMDASGRNIWSKLQTAGNEKKTYRGGVLQSKGPVPRRGPDAEALIEEYPKLSLTAWMHLYCASHAHLKSFRVQRTVSGLDTNYLNAALQALISSTNYRGHTRITFPIANAATEMHSTNRINLWRFNQWICFFFYVTFLWLITWPYLFFATRKWAIVSVDWPYSVTDEYGVKTYASISEEEWFGKWAKCIKGAVLAKKKGTLTGHDLVASEVPEPPFRSGSAAIDRVVEVFGAGIRGAREVRRQWGWGGDC